MVVAIRSAVNLGERSGRYADHFDENDYSSTTVLALVDGEPAGTMRCRWFAEFARFEKLAVRQPYRRFAVLNAIVNKAARLARRKGYSKVSGMALPEVVPYWTRRGGLTPGQPFETSYGTVVPLAGPLPEAPDITAIMYQLAGDEGFERAIHAWEGGGV